MNVTVIYTSCLYFEVVWFGRAEPVVFVFQSALKHKHRAKKRNRFQCCDPHLNLNIPAHTV